MRTIDEKLLAAYDEKTRKGYPLGEVRQDLLELGYTDAEAAAFMNALGARIAQKVAHREQRLQATAALLLVACGVVLTAFGLGTGAWFILVGLVWWGVDFARRNRPRRR
ncbi:hypothetical protein EPD60_08340 [Flaviaesturariibacter flavus]|uniref:Uncharacterized protein n=1 Tax=Flaviaesturariibacter flavus TaxID=2502780 RepID=A0A4R1BAN9_9BACT|nr:hypothetical protein [Flaviaesturariibacter flavus]TCJ14014.1 hypothetical protein EPD60_08340 [Flaviaesturariibacter flavus]